MKKPKLITQLTAHLMTAALIISGANVPSTTAFAAKKITLTKSAKVAVGKKTTLRLKNNKKKVTWSVISGKKNIKLSAKKKTSVTVKGVKKGNAKVQAKIGKKKFTCRIQIVKKSQTAIVSASPLVTASVPAASPSVNIPAKTPVPTVSPKAMTSSAPVTPSAIVPDIPKTSTSPAPDDNPGTEVVYEKNEADVTAIRKIIASQNSLGASVNDDLDSDSYGWKNGRLSRIKWENNDLQGSIDFGELPELGHVFCGSNKQLTSVNVSKNNKLTELGIDNTGISSVDLSALSDMQWFN